MYLPLPGLWFMICGWGFVVWVLEVLQTRNPFGLEGFYRRILDTWSRLSIYLLGVES